jgi:subtilisin family serine protease
LLVAVGGALTSAGGEARAQSESQEEPSFNTSSEPEFAEGEILVKPEESAPGNRLGEVNRANNAQVEERLPEVGITVVDLPRDLPVQAAVSRYENAPGIEYAEPNYKLQPSATKPNDPRYDELYGLNNTGQTGGTNDSDIDAPEAWDITTGSQRTITAVIDSGTNIGHPDLRDNVWVNRDEIAGNNKDDDKNGYVDDVNGWDFFNGDNSVYDPADGDEHGTHVSGTVAAQGNNDRGVTGVNWDAQIMPLKFIGPDFGFTSDAVKAIDYAVDNGANISNNSWGGGGNSQSLKDAITRAGNQGHLFVAAAGNASNDNDQNPFYPASYDNNNIISVAATDSADQLASFSNFGSNTVDLGAPGVGILSTVPGNDYQRFSGTSMASPHVAGVAALLESQNPGSGALDLKRTILNNAEPVSDLNGVTVTGDRLNAARALGSSNLTLSAGRRALEFPGKVGFGGFLTSGGDPVANQKIELLQRPLGADNFRPVPDGETTTNSDGKYVIRGVNPRKHTYYRARFGGGQNLDTAISGAERVNVRVKVTIRGKESNLQLGQRRGFVGRVLPKHRGPVRLIVKRNGSLVDRERTRLSSNSTYRFVYRPQRPGNYAVFVVRPKDVDHLGNRSDVKRFRVVR